MRGLLRTSIVLSIGFFIIYALLKGVMYYKVHSTLSSMQTELYGKAEFVYQDIETNLLKETIRVTSINITPEGATEGVDIDYVEIKGLGPVYVLSELVNFSKNKPPEALQFLASGTRLDLNSDIVLQLPGNTIGKTVDGCSDGNQMDVELLKDMGLSEIVFDLDGHYALRESLGELDVDFNLEIHDIQSINIAISFAEVSVSAIKAGAQIPALASFDFDFKMEPKFGARYSNLCAEKKGQSVDAFKASLIKQAKQNLARSGITPGRGINNAIKEFYQSWGNISVQARPVKPVGLMSLVFLPPAQWVNAMSLQMVVNEKLITDLSFTWDKTKQGVGLPGMLGMAPPKKKLGEVKKRYRKEFKTVPVDELTQHITKDVRLHVKGEPIRQGILSAVNASEVSVVQRLQGGKFTAHVLLSEIDKAEVQYRILIKKK